MSRPRGFVDWRPQKKTLPRLTAVQDVLEQYAAYLPLTIRQIFYRLVGTDVIGKTEKEYGSLCELLNRATRAHIIPMDAIRDDGFIGGYGTRVGYIGSEEFREEMRLIAEEYVGDRQRGQEWRLVLWCEAGGMVPQLERIAHEYSVTVKSSGGFDSRTVKHTLGDHWDGVNVLHVGDYDPSGECMFDALTEDVEAFARHYGNDIEFVRLVTPEQIAAFDLPTAPPKRSSHQTKKAMAFTTQAEALNPADLAEIVRQGIESRLDLDVYRHVVKLEESERRQVLQIVGGAS